jgi:hypothetical protein
MVVLNRDQNEHVCTAAENVTQGISCEGNGVKSQVNTFYV